MNSVEKMDIIFDIQKTKGAKAKADILAKHPELQNILKLTYNPYVHFNIKPTKEWLGNCGTGVFETSTSHLLKALAEGRLTGSAAKRAVITEFERLEPFSQQLLFNILNKDMAMGMRAKSINKIWPGLIPEFPIQLANKLDDKHLKFPIIGTYKIDGLRCLYKNGHLYTRYGRRFIGLERLEELLRPYSGLTLDGELTVPGKTFDDLSGELRSFRPTDNVIYHIFDVGICEPQFTRLANVDLIVNHICHSMVQVVPRRTLFDSNEMLEMFNEAREQGYEGLVLKDDNALPYDGRSYAWMKMKASDTVDIEVYDVIEGKGKYEGHVGALECLFNDLPVYVGTGLTDSQREKWFANPNLIMGKTIEVEYMEISKNGALRHPRLKSVRGDK